MHGDSTFALVRPQHNALNSPVSCTSQTESHCWLHQRAPLQPAAPEYTQIKCVILEIPTDTHVTYSRPQFRYTLNHIKGLSWCYVWLVSGDAEGSEVGWGNIAAVSNYGTHTKWISLCNVLEAKSKDKVVVATCKDSYQNLARRSQNLTGQGR